jgi:hypothetical protein
MRRRPVATETARKAPTRRVKPHCKTCRCNDQEAEYLWNNAIDWLLNSRHTADPDIQRAFWGMVDGKLTRDEADAGGEAVARSDADA